jgi:predicted Zn-dependent peptidase
VRLLLALAALAATLHAEVRLPKYARQVLPNGIVLNVVPRADVPLVTIRVVIRGGIESEPAEDGGLAAATADALRRGTATRTADQFSTEIDALGAILYTGADMQSTSLSLELLSKDLESGLELMVDAISRPVFPEAEVKKLLAQRVDSAKAAKDDPRYAASEYYRNFFFGSQHPYGRPADEVTFSKMTRNDLIAYHKRFYVGRNMIVVVAGDVDPVTATPKIAAAFSTISEGRAYTWTQAPLPKRDHTRVAIVDKPDATQTNFLIGVPGIDRTDPDRVALWLVNTLFGGRFTSMLNDQLRVNSGLTYGANSRVDENRLKGRISISSFTRTETTSQAVDMAIQTLRKLADEGITEEQLASAKAYVKGTYPAQHLETANQVADVVAELELFGLNRGEVDDLFSRVDALTLDQANAIAKRYFSADKLTILLLGNASEFAESMKKYDSDPAGVSLSVPGLRVPQ